jgi:hypothetical protein
MILNKRKKEGGKGMSFLSPREFITTKKGIVILWPPP